MLSPDCRYTSGECTQVSGGVICLSLLLLLECQFFLLAFISSTLCGGVCLHVIFLAFVSVLCCILFSSVFFADLLALRPWVFCLGNACAKILQAKT